MITLKQIELLQASWQLIDRGDMHATGVLFYNYLFEIAPELRPVFGKTPVKEQSGKFLSMVNYFIMNLHHPHDAMDAIAILARQHISYGVQEEQYTLVGRALLHTVETVLGDGWNKELKQAWITGYTMLAESMMKASELYRRQNERVY